MSNGKMNPNGCKVIHDYTAPFLPKLIRKHFKVVSALEWREKFWEHEQTYGDFSSWTIDGWCVTAVTDKGVYHMRKGTRVVHCIPDPDLQIFLKMTKKNNSF